MRHEEIRPLPCVHLGESLGGDTAAAGCCGGGEEVPTYRCALPLYKTTSIVWCVRCPAYVPRLSVAEPSNETR
jgi:hypothetical protein